MDHPSSHASTASSYSHSHHDSVMCEGTDEATGHPRVYLYYNDNGVITCPYCNARFERDA